ncbi:cytochrome aa3-600 menaquinol oxidase subunit 3 [Pullulanibacillus pueri]|uniref:Quinol oxidase subunit 3 n=1 Tax=Pullulanibacillus pueri TaxID=1437324 RepID=A0A8J3ENA2_9BACL|nr:cytochrome aa3 quinol oxidase subunit III [Pullulanibacillus pueri]MBM7683216.1 cytochrome aa3-600 menaquinol oxidase subunit 3 [Pullulanibacillus pueri]GGH85549.1 cytochrome aa3 quinol oxidase subunit III [Pullulanibacillus pueri]
MSQSHSLNNQTPLEYSTEDGRLKIFGFWVFLGAEIILFSCLFASYMVYLHRTAGGPTPDDLFNVKEFMTETFLLLTSSFTCGLATHELRRHNKTGVIIWFIITLILGLGFVGMEAHEFVDYVGEGAKMSTSAFLTGFFTLVGTHGCHVSLGILWIIGILIQTARTGINPVTARKLFIVGLYWHFLDVVWVFIFTVVYLTGMVL